MSKCGFCETPCGNDWCPYKKEIRMNLVEDKLEDLFSALSAEYDTKEPPVIFLDERTYYQLVKDMQKRSRAANGGELPDDSLRNHLGVTWVTPYGFNAKIFNKNQLYALTNVINKICEVE